MSVTHARIFAFSFLFSFFFCSVFSIVHCTTLLRHEIFPSIVNVLKILSMLSPVISTHFHNRLRNLWKQYMIVLYNIYGATHTMAEKKMKYRSYAASDDVTRTLWKMLRSIADERIRAVVHAIICSRAKMYNFMRAKQKI